MTDVWTSISATAWMAVSGTRVVEGRIEAILLDFVKLTDRHTGAYMADKIYDVVEFYGLIDRVSHFVLII